MKSKVFTNCFLVKTDQAGKLRQVCLAMKKRGFGQGKWNGAGGKPEERESVGNAARREVEEEFGVQVTRLEKRGEIDFILKREEKVVKMHTFLAVGWEGTPAETEEMKPEWFDTDKIPYGQMWDTDKEWLPLILAGKKIKAKYTYPDEGGKVEKREITEVKSLV